LDLEEVIKGGRRWRSSFKLEQDERFTNCWTMFENGAQPLQRKIHERIRQRFSEKLFGVGTSESVKIAILFAKRMTVAGYIGKP
jgi:hypothetical protein